MGKKIIKEKKYQGKNEKKLSYNQPEIFYLRVLFVWFICVFYLCVLFAYTVICLFH